MIEETMELVIDEYHKKSKSIEDAGLLKNVTGKLSEGRKTNIEELYMDVAFADLVNGIGLETPAIHFIIAGLYTIRTFDSDTWSHLKAAAEQNKITEEMLDTAIMTYQAKPLPHAEFHIFMGIFLDNERLEGTPKWRKFLAKTILATTKYARPASPSASPDIIMPALKHMNDTSPELVYKPSSEVREEWELWREQAKYL